ncbi:hypothetical protein KYC5002_51160 [Archangium violaceum]|uniref:hypothetical protein n=1 Tax=Archangium violaceum TaxID=83451 RepID=UPI002B2D0971|nr:hypothetical protein KYC5002_51160 [Archangium gephyra]
MRLVLLLSIILVGNPLGTAYAASDFERYLTAATQLYENLEYELALEQLAQARKVARGVEEDVTLALYEGIILAELSQWEQARARFLTALLLNPEAKLPLSVAPKTKNEFEAQRARALLEFARQQHQEEPPQAPIAQRPLEVATDRPERTSTQEPRLTPDTPPAPMARVEEVRAPSRMGPAVPLALLGAGAVAAGVGTWFGMESRRQVNAAWGAHYQSEVLSHRAEAERSARTANILFGSAGVAVAGAVVSWLLMPPRAESPSGETR